MSQLINGSARISLAARRRKRGKRNRRKLPPFLTARAKADGAWMRIPEITPFLHLLPFLPFLPFLPPLSSPK
jgi:hypothetical protein